MLPCLAMPIRGGFLQQVPSAQLGSAEPFCPRNPNMGHALGTLPHDVLLPSPLPAPADRVPWFLQARHRTRGHARAE